MFDVLDTLVGAGVAGFFFIWGKRSPSTARKHREIKAICGCQHHRSFHKNDEACAVLIRNSDTGWKPKACGCQHYRGPKPYSEVMDEIEGSDA